jgi:hypothetical protein
MVPWFIKKGLKRVSPDKQASKGSVPINKHYCHWLPPTVARNVRENPWKEEDEFTRFQFFRMVRLTDQVPLSR